MMLFDFMIVLSCGGAGLVCGWTMHAISVSGQPAAKSVGNSSAPSPPCEPAPSEGVKEDRQRIGEVADRLKSYAHEMAADVDAHQTKVQAVNNTLNGIQGSSPEAVSEAIHEMIEANEAMQAQLQNAQDRIHEQTLQIESAEKRAETDALTRVPNRGAFDKHLAQRHALGSGAITTLAMLDVDHFKKFNDVYGHRAGDEVLRVVAGMLHSRLNQRGMVARFGGEEFAVILDDCNLQEASQFVEEARAAISQREIQFEGKRLQVTASVGLAQLEKDEEKEQWLQRADDGLYHSKEAGRDCSHSMDGETPIKVEPTQTELSAASGTTSNQSSEKPETPDAAQLITGAFASLPDRESMEEAFEAMRGRAGASVSTFFMAIRCHQDVPAASIRSLLQVVRATLRSVDHLGCHDKATLLICMPSVDRSTAQSRAEQICRSAKAIGLADQEGANQEGANQEGGSRSLSIGVTEVRENEGFDEVVENSLHLVDQGRHADADAVTLDLEPAIA